MGEQQTQQTQGQQESFTSGGVTYVGAVESRYGRLQEALEEFRRQAEWLGGYLFVVSEHFSIGGDSLIPERAVISYLDEVPKVTAEAEAALLEVERLAGDLRQALMSSAGEKRERAGTGIPGGYSPEMTKRLRLHEAQARKAGRKTSRRREPPEPDEPEPADVPTSAPSEPAPAAGPSPTLSNRG